jgi:AcrB/AcrD/AcrF family
MSGLAGQLAGLEPRDKGRFRRLSDPTGRNVSEARAGLESDNADADLQDWSLRYGLSKAEGVAEIASVGGFVKQYNVVIDPQRLRSFDIPLSKARSAIRASNMDFGGRTVELSEFEFVVRGRGYLKGIPDLRKIVLKNDGGTPVLLEDVARIELGPDERRGLTELNGDGEVASSIVLQRFGANALEVIDNVKNRLSELAGSLPKGVDIQTVYDRSALIRAAIENLRHTLLEEGLIVALVCFLFLLHVRSALVAILMLPVGVLMAFAAMKALGLGSNIMSLGGIAIAIGAMVDAAIVMIENAHKHLERAQPGTPRVQILIAAASEVGPALFFSLLIITVSFLPIFSLEAQQGRLFKPLAYTKTFSMAAAALLSVTLVPALMIVFVRGRIIPEQKNPLNRFLIWLYRPMSCGRHFRLQRWSALYCSPCARPTIFPVSRATTTPVNILKCLFAPSVSVMIWPRSIRPISTSILSYRCSTPKKSICPATNVPSLRFAHWSAQCNGADASRLATPPTGTMMLPMLAGAADVAYNYTLFDTSWSFVDGTPYETDAERRQHESDENFRWRLGNYMRSIGAGW